MPGKAPRLVNHNHTSYITDYIGIDLPQQDKADRLLVIRDYFQKNANNTI